MEIIWVQTICIEIQIFGVPQIIQKYTNIWVFVICNRHPYWLLFFPIQNNSLTVMRFSHKKYSPTPKKPLISSVLTPRFLCFLTDSKCLCIGLSLYFIENYKIYYMLNKKKPKMFNYQNNFSRILSCRLIT